MMIITRSNHHIRLRRLNPNDPREIDKLIEYLNSLDGDTKRRFGPHQFDKDSISGLFKQRTDTIGFVAQDINQREIIAYSLIMIGYLEHDRLRLESYSGMKLSCETDATFAPSVADKWQNQGLGSTMFKYIVSVLRNLGIKRIILWGGVQADNDRAVMFYKRNGFRELGVFNYEGDNYDMTLDL